MKATLTNPPPQCYYEGTGRFQELLGLLKDKMPDCGEVLNKEENSCLELLRQANNCYYYLFKYNANHADFKSIFGRLARGKTWKISQDGWLDRQMDKIIWSAAIEQGFVKRLGSCPCQSHDDTPASNAPTK